MPAILSSALSLPPATRALTLTLVAGSLLFLLLRLSVTPHDLKSIFGATGDVSLVFPWLVLVPGKVYRAPWTLLTSAFVETNLVEFLLSALTLPLAARYLERVWGAVEVLKFVVVTIVASNIITCVVSVVEAIVLGNKELFLYGTSYHGLMALQVGFLVAFTQLIPEHQVQIFGGLAKVRVKSLPMLYVTFSNIACVLGYISPYILIQFGWLAAWFYLRFFKYNEGVDFRGDRSETFAFHNWFPPFIQKYVQAAAGFAFSLAVKFHLLPAWGLDPESGVPGSGSGYTQVPGGQRAEAERRRQLALEALDRRMQAPPTNGAALTGLEPQAQGPPMASPALSMAGSAGGGAPSPGLAKGGAALVGEDK
ncbi:hypothetical protein JCM9279_005410 [Rhodotorula babjevae]